MEKKIHQGKNITRFRQMLGMKQDALASELGDDWNQIKVSRLEAKEEIEDRILNDVAKVLRVPVEAIKTFEAGEAINYVNTFNDTSSFNYQCNFNPLDKLIEAMEKNEKLYEELLKSERERIALLERMLGEKK